MEIEATQVIVIINTSDFVCLSVDLSGLRNDSNFTTANMKDISSEATAALENAALKLEKSVDAGNLSIFVEGETLLPKVGSFVTSEVQETCSEGQVFKNKLCGKCHQVSFSITCLNNISSKCVRDILVIAFVMNTTHLVMGMLTRISCMVCLTTMKTVLLNQLIL